VITDWLIVRRLAAELEPSLRGARVRGGGLLEDGRFALELGRASGRRGGNLLAVDAFGPLPIVTLEDGEPPAKAGGWAGAIVRSLEGRRIERIQARRGDRLIAIDCASNSRFGVSDRVRLVLELVPRFGNLVLLKDDTVIAAAKEFTRAENARRATLVGEPYEPPPLPAIGNARDSTSSVSGEAAGPGEPAVAAAFATLAAGGAGESTLKAAARALRGAVPLLPALVAESFAAEAARLPVHDGEALGARVLARARALVEATAGEPAGLGDIFVYREGGAIRQCHVVPLHQFAALECERVPALLPVLFGAERAERTKRRAGAGEQARNALRARSRKRLDALTRERAVLERERADAESRERLRQCGEALYAYGAQLAPGATSFVPPDGSGLPIALDPALDAKANAAAYFKRYRKATAKLVHTAARLAALESELSAAEQLAWEIDTAPADVLGELRDALDAAERRRPKRREPQHALGPRVVPLADDARLLIGRSPRTNAEVTFRSARPGDLWFHARQIPGAHVILQIDGSRNATEDELRSAAEAAAYHSKGRERPKVDVDYTERKHVRKQRDAAAGLVWYTDARTLRVTPIDSAAAGIAELPAGR
jgi:predicted ribosome quality control (RQC) complex YloA/Tae2 family protein